MSALAPIASRLGQLLWLLASDKDGEVLAAAHELRRIVAAHSCDFHDLANVIEAGEMPYRRRETAPVYDTSKPLHECESMRRSAVACPWALDDREAEFVRDLGRRFGCGRLPSRKQAAWLEAIHARLLANGGGWE